MLDLASMIQELRVKNESLQQMYQSQCDELKQWNSRLTGGQIVNYEDKAISEKYNQQLK